MDFVYIKSTEKGNEGKGSIHYRFPVGNGKRSKVALGIELSEEEWKAYHYGTYEKDEEMPCLGITYGKFAKFMDIIGKTVDESQDKTNIKMVVQSVMMKLITSS